MTCHRLITCSSLPWIWENKTWNAKMPHYITGALKCQISSLSHNKYIFFLVVCSCWFFSSDFPVSFLHVILFLFLFFILFTPHCSSWGDYIPCQHALSEARLLTAFAAHIAREEQNDAFEHWRFCLQMIKIIQCGGRPNAMTKLWEKIKVIKSGTCSESDPVAP